MRKKPKDPAETGPVPKMSITLQDRVANWLAENSSLGLGDLRTPVTLEALQRTESADYWVIERMRLGRAAIMELMLDMVADGYSIPAILSLPGMPKSRTVMGWIREYRPFRELLEVAGEMYAHVKANEAEEILDGSLDPEQAFRDKARADLRMRLAENFNPKKFGKKQQIDVNHHDDLSNDDVISRLRSVLISHRDVIEEKMGIKIIIPTFDAEVVSVEPEPEPTPAEPMTLGFQGTSMDDLTDVSLEDE